MTRTFIALDLNEPLQRFLGEILRQGALALPALRWVDPTSMHLTLAFLGELPPEQLALAMQATEAAAPQVPPFEYRLSEPGTFDSARQPRVVWMGIREDSGSLLQLHRLLNRELERRGFQIDQQPLSPHLTLARVKASLSPVELLNLQRLLAESRVPPSLPPHIVTHVNVMKSELSRAGARYRVLREYALGEPES